MVMLDQAPTFTPLFRATANQNRVVVKLVNRERPRVAATSASAWWARDCSCRLQR